MNIVEIKNLSKKYALYEKQSDRLKEVLSPFRKSYHKDFYALKDISLNVEKGEALGIIGVNGSGKSTLLKIITGVLSQTSGTVEVHGKVSALLELGAGFNPEYTGLENIYLNGTMMGYSKKEIDERLNDILEFADIGEFINQPVKQYSSGMFVRLAFALSINVHPDILIVDEALSVGDIFFQAKCFKKISDMKNEGTTIIMVTHDMGSILKYCDRALLLNKGDMVTIGNPHDTVDAYKRILAGADAGETKETKDSKINPSIYGNGKAEIFEYGIYDKKGEKTNVILKGEEFSVREKIKINDDIEEPIFTFTIKDKKGLDLTGTNSSMENKNIGKVKKGDEFEISWTQVMMLERGEYLISISVTGFEAGTHTVYHRLYDIMNIIVLSNSDKVGIFDQSTTLTVTKTK